MQSTFWLFLCSWWSGLYPLQARYQSINPVTSGFAFRCYVLHKPWVARGPTKGNSGSAYRGSTIHGLALAPLLSFRKEMEYARWDRHGYWTNCMHSNIDSRKWHQLDLKPVSTNGSLGLGWKEMIGKKKRKSKKGSINRALLPHEPAHGRFLIAQVGAVQSVSRTSTANRIYYSTYLPPPPAFTA